MRTEREIHRRLRGTQFVLVLFLFSGGCSSKGSVTGKVFYQGKPLDGGTVLFVPEQGGGLTSQIQADGSYSIVKLPPGLVKIAVSTPKPPEPPRYTGRLNYLMDKEKKEKRQNAAGKGPPAKQSIQIPQHFGDPEKSGLTYTVQNGPQTYDIQLNEK
jgi:hypothetical protein